MYRPETNKRERGMTLAAVLLVHAGIGLALLNLTGAVEIVKNEDLTQLINIGAEPPPPPEVEMTVEDDAAPEAEGAASAKNIESNATPVAAPKPRIALPVPAPMPVTETPNTGSDPTQGASDVVGPGTGAGGVGTGTGSGGSGSGTGGGGRGAGTRPALVSAGLTARDYPPEIARSWPRGGQVFVAIRVQLDGRATDCRVDRSFGNPAADQWTCSLVMNKLRFRPATDDNGRPFVSWYGYVQRDTGRMR
jgi:protein TonB